MPHQEAAWALLAERLDVAAWLCGELCSGRGTAISGRLEPVLGALREIAASLAGHLGTGRPQAALAAAAPRLRGADLDALATACTAILDGIPASPPARDAARAGTGLLTALGALPGPGGQPAAGDPDAAAAAGRLREAVLAATRLRAGLRRLLPPGTHRSGGGAAGPAAPGRAASRRRPGGTICGGPSPACPPRSRPPATVLTWSRTRRPW